MNRARTSRLTLLLPALTLLLGTPSWAQSGQMIPLTDERETSVEVAYQGLTDRHDENQPAPFATWHSAFGVDIQHPNPEIPGSCGASTFQDSEFFPNGIFLAGGTGGAWSVLPGQYNALSTVNFTYQVDQCMQITADTQYDAGDLGTDGTLELGVPGANLTYYNWAAGAQHVEGRIPPGTYEAKGVSYILSTLENTQGPVFSLIWVCVPCATSLIWTPPRDQTVGCGATTVFTVQPNGPVNGFTYQWRRNLVPLTNSAHVSGVTTPMLTIQNTCTADEGHYDVVLTDGSGIVEPSRLARLGVVTATGVDPIEEGSPLAFALSAAGPNPFDVATSFRYAARTPQRAFVAVYNAAGLEVRTLLDQVVSGTGVITWDGNTSSGSRAPAGIYFIRAQAGAVRENRKVVLLR